MDKLGEVVECVQRLCIIEKSSRQGDIGGKPVLLELLDDGRLGVGVVSRQA